PITSSILRPAIVEFRSFRNRLVPCSIWMPPCASGPVLTVRSPILTGLFWAIAGIGRFAAKAAPAAPLSQLRRVILEAILAFLPNGSFAAAHAKASRVARRAATWCGKRRSRGGLLAHLQEGAAVAGVAEGDKEDRRA